MTLYVLVNLSRRSFLKDCDGSIKFYTKKKFARTQRESYRNSKGLRTYDILRVKFEDLVDLIINNANIDN